ncbi:Cellulase protein [Cinnamomum micranthum f. kanehirae]|uniref:Cellulase protein n=1 Tax=Cinnamomum micranthum f. kanehirae TaxID=337451 RepID=A0A443PPH1_9MAGN|nr:Cellulase protein [Cinnamomum micranthum f. kanehirae]
MPCHITGEFLCLMEAVNLQRGINVNDNRFLNCFYGIAAKLDLDWALWTLQGSYYIREGTIGLDEKYGLLDWSWCQLRNSSFLQRLSALQSPHQGLLSESLFFLLYSALSQVLEKFT